MSGYCGKMMSAAARLPRKPDTKSRQQKNVTRYVSGELPTKKARLGTSRPGSTR